jgi:hypothetical protein
VSAFAGHTNVLMARLARSSFRIAVFIPICALANDTAMNQPRRTCIFLYNDLHLLGATCFFLDNDLHVLGTTCISLDNDLHLLDTTCIFLDNECFLWNSTQDSL